MSEPEYETVTYTLEVQIPADMKTPSVEEIERAVYQGVPQINTEDAVHVDFA